MSEMNPPDWRLISPCRIELIGPSGSGKSETMLKLVEDDSVWKTPCNYVIYAAPVLSDRTEFLGKLAAIIKATSKKLLINEGLLKTRQIIEFSGGRPVLYLVDDLPMMQDCSGINDLNAMEARHLNINCVFALQTPFMKKKSVDLPSFSRNMTNRFLFYQRADYRLFQTLNARIFPERKHWILDCLNYAKEVRGLKYIHIDMHPESSLDRRFMTMTGFFKNERHHDSPIFLDITKKSLIDD